ncbi:MAG: polyprenyl diphosphate synthase [Gemmatimonadota bacterium]
MSSSAADLRLQLPEQTQRPRHVAIIMDGNGRWAQQNGLPRWRGHRQGMKAVREAVEGALEADLEFLTLYAFSQENWSRPRLEVRALMSLLCEFVEIEKQDLRKQGVRVKFFGQLERLSQAARSAVQELERHTADQTKMQLNFAISYGSRDEIVGAARRLAERVADGDISPSEVTEESMSEEMLTAGWPDPDLLIRTSGEFRISNFLLWQIAYAEIHVTNVLWPDFTRADLYGALRDFAARERRFGGVGGPGGS